MFFGFKSNNPKRFSYKPLFWDKDKEEREARRRSILGSDYDGKEYKPGTLIKDGQLRRMQTSNRSQKQSKVTLIRAAIFVFLLFMMLYTLTDFFGML